VLESIRVPSSTGSGRPAGPAAILVVLATDRAVAEAETSPDHNEGIDAFFEKRAARWSPLP
jgi:hypothetical protein